MPSITRKIWVSGLVQGVNFRRSTQVQAEQLQLTGWVKNLDDGRVLVIAQGAEQEVSRLIRWLHYGPTAASVREVEVKEIVLKDEYLDFSIR